MDHFRVFIPRDKKQSVFTRTFGVRDYEVTVRRLPSRHQLYVAKQSEQTLHGEGQASNNSASSKVIDKTENIAESVPTVVQIYEKMLELVTSTVVNSAGDITKVELTSPQLSKRVRKRNKRKENKLLLKEAQEKRVVIQNKLSNYSQTLSGISSPDSISCATSGNLVSKLQLQIAAIKAEAIRLGPLPATRACVKLPDYIKTVIEGIHTFVNQEVETDTRLQRLSVLYNKARHGDLVDCSWCKCSECSRFPDAFKDVINFKLFSTISKYSSRSTKDRKVNTLYKAYGKKLEQLPSDVQTYYLEDPSYSIHRQNKVCKQIQLANLKAEKQRKKDRAKRRAVDKMEDRANDYQGDY